jgi:hypothetical protein
LRSRLQLKAKAPAYFVFLLPYGCKMHLRH